MKHDLQKTKGINITEQKANELEKTIQNLSEEKTDLEQQHFAIRSQYRAAQDKLDKADARAETAALLEEKLKNATQDQKSKDLIEISQKLQSAKLKEYQQKRKAEELDERVNYMQKLIKNKDESLFKLEEKAATFES